MTTLASAPLAPAQTPRLTPRDADDLRWLLLGDYRGDCGIRSNFGDMIDALTQVAGHNDADEESWHIVTCHETHSRKAYDLGEDMLDAADELRASLARWGSLDPFQRETLELTYGAVRRELPEWGDVGPLVRRSLRAQRAWARDQHRNEKPLAFVAWLARLPQRAALAAVKAELRAEAEERMGSACRAWERSLAAGEETRRRPYRSRRRRFHAP